MLQLNQQTLKTVYSKRKSYWSFVWYIGFVFPLVFGQNQPSKWTLETCVQYTLQNNIQIKQTGLEKDLAEIAKKDAIGSFLPSMNAFGTHSWNIGLNQNITTGLLENQTTQFTSAGLNVGVDIYNGMQNQNRLQRARLQKIAAQYQLLQMQDDIALNVANAYLQILFNKEALKVQQSQLKTNKEQMARAKELWEAGQIPKGDYLDRTATVAADEQRVIQAENALLLSKLSLGQLLQLENYQNFDIADEDYQMEKSPLLLEKAETIFNKAKEIRYEIKIAENNIALAEKDVKIAKGAFQPRLTGFYAFNTRAAYFDRIIGFQQDPNNPFTTIGVVEGTNQNVIRPNLLAITGNPLSVWEQFDINKGQSFGVQLNIPILNGLSVRNNVARSKVLVKRSELALEQETLNLERNVFTAYSDAQGAQKAYEAAITALEARKEAYFYASERYQVGLLNTYDLTQAQNLLTAAESEVLRTKYDYLFRTKILALSFGLPIYERP